MRNKTSENSREFIRQASKIVPEGNGHPEPSSFNGKLIYVIHRAGRSVLGETVPDGLRPRAQFLPIRTDLCR